MKVYFRHKKSNSKISLDELKSNPNCNHCIQIRTVGICKEYNYNARSIPLSDDFEIICDQKEFNSDELYILREALYNNPYLMRTNEVSQLMNKVGKMCLNKELLENN